MRLVKVAVSVGILALLLILLPWEHLREAWRALSITVWLGVLAGFIAGHLVGVAKWRMMVNASSAGGALDLPDATRCYAAGLFANLCLPTIVGGDVLRAGLAARATGLPQASFLGGIVDRMIDVASLAILIAIGGVIAGGDVIAVRGTVIALVVALSAGVILLFAPVLLRRPMERLKGRYARHVLRGRVALRSLGRQPAVGVTALILSLAVQSGFVLLNAWIGWSLGIEVSLGVWFLAWPLAKAAALLPISIGGLGVREAALAGLLLPFGVPAALATVVSLAWQSVLLVGGLLGGALWWAAGRLDERFGSVAFFPGRQDRQHG